MELNDTHDHTHTAGDIVYTRDGSHRRAWRVDRIGDLTEINSVTHEPLDDPGDDDDDWG